MYKYYEQEEKRKGPSGKVNNTLGAISENYKPKGSIDNFSFKEGSLVKKPAAVDKSPNPASPDKIKSIASEIFDLYKSSIGRISEKYAGIIKGINDSYQSDLASVEGDAYAAKNAASASKKINDSNSKKILMDKGLSNSGESVRNELYNNLSYQNRLGAIEAGAIQSKGALASEKDSKIFDLEAKKISEETDLHTKMTDEYSQALADERDYNYKVLRDKIQDKLESDELNYEKNRDYIEDVRKSREFEYQKERDQAKDGQWQSELDYKKIRDAANDAQWLSELDYKRQRDNVKDSQWRTEFDYEALQDSNQDAKWRSEHDLDYQKLLAQKIKDERSYQLDAAAQNLKEKYFELDRSGKKY